MVSMKVFELWRRRTVDLRRLRNDPAFARYIHHVRRHAAGRRTNLEEATEVKRRA
jgi:hypothetical protein